MITRVFPFMRGPAHLRVVPREADVNELLRGDKGTLPTSRRLPADVDTFVRHALTLEWDQAVDYVDKNLDRTLGALREIGLDDGNTGLELERMKEEIESPEMSWTSDHAKLYRSENDFDPRKGDVDWSKVRSILPAHFNGWVDALEKSTQRTVAEAPNLPFDIGFDLSRFYREQWQRWRNYSLEMASVSDDLDKAVQELDDFKRDLPYLRIDDLQEIYPDLAAEALKKAEERQWMVEDDVFYFNDKLADEEQASRQVALEAWAKQFRAEEQQYITDLVSGNEPKPLTQWSFIDLLNTTGTNPIDKTPKVVVNDHHHH